MNPPLIVGVSYTVTGREADQWFGRGTTVTFAAETTQWIDKGERQAELSFATTDGKTVVLRGDALTGLVAGVPREPAPAGAQQCQDWSRLFLGVPEVRAQAFARLAGHKDALWHRALVFRALADRAAGAKPFEGWATRNPAAAPSLVPLLLDGRLVGEPPVRLLFARIHHPYFLPLLEQELSSTDLPTLRAALDEVALYPTGTLAEQVNALTRHENPSVAIKAQRLCT